jgi:hypothetical protein
MKGSTMATQKVKHMKRIGGHVIQAVPYLNVKQNGQGYSPANPVQLGTQRPKFHTAKVKQVKHAHEWLRGKCRLCAAQEPAVIMPTAARPGVFEGVVVKVKHSMSHVAKRRATAIEMARVVVEQAIAEYRATKHIVGSQARGAH